MQTSQKTTTEMPSPFLRRMKQNFRDNKNLFISVCLLQLFGLPALSIGFQVYAAKAGKQELQDPFYSFSSFNSSEVYMILFFISFSLACASGILFCFKSFNYLYKKKNVDMVLSLPLTGTQRFLSDFFSGLLMYIIPYISSVILTAISLSIGKYFLSISGNQLITAGYSTRSDISYVINQIFASCPLLYYAFVILMAMIMLYTLTTFITVCCGNILESFVYTILINLGIPIFIFTIFLIVFSDIPGISYSNSSVMPIMATSPLGGLVRLVFFGDYSEADPYSFSSDLSNICWIISYLFIIVVLFVGSFVLYKKRKAEDVSKPFVFRFIYNIFIFMATICLAGAIHRAEQTVLAIIVSFIFFIVLDTIKNRGIRHIFRSLMFYAASLTLAISLSEISDATHGFGCEYRLPKASSVKSVSLQYHNMYNSFTDINFTDRSDIEKVIQLHKDTTDYYRTHDYDILNYSISTGVNTPPTSRITNMCLDIPSVSICYLMKSGNLLYRSYNVPYSIFIENTAFFELSKQRKNEKADAFAKMLESVRDENCYEYQNRESLRIQSPNRLLSDKLDTQNTELLNALAESYRKDIDAQTEKDLMNNSAYCFIEYTFIGENFKNTIAVLEKYNIDIPSPSDADVFPEEENFINDRLLLISDSDYIIKNFMFTTNLITASAAPSCQYYVSEYDDKLFSELLSVAQPSYITDEHCYLIYCNYQNYLIPPEYSELAEKFMESSRLEPVPFPDNFKKIVQAN